MTRIEVDIPEGISNDYEIARYTSETTDNMWQMYLDMKNEEITELSMRPTPYEYELYFDA